MSKEKLQFLKQDFPALLHSGDPSKAAVWGSMNFIQMIEHMTDAISQAYGKSSQALITPADKLEKVRNFALSDLPFKPNTKNSLMSEVPAAAKHSDIGAAIAALEAEILLFENYYTLNKNGQVLNPFFGNFNFEEWTHLLHKHALHHLKQFSLVE